MQRRFTLVSFLLLVVAGFSTISAQLSFPEGGFIFGDENVPRIDLSMDEADLASLYADKYSDTEYPADFKFTRDDLSETVQTVGVRFRGNTSRDKQKMSFRVSFNTFEAGRKFHELEKLNLNAETNDPSMIRSKLSWHLFRKLGVPASRSNHVLLYINNDFYGVYINTEHIDEVFAKSRFDTNDGNLYKCLWPADLAYRGSDQSNYKFESYGQRPYALRINEEWDDFGDLAAMITILHGYSGETLRAKLEQHINIDQYLKVMAVDILTGNWDGYIGNQNNYYLYRDPESGCFEFIPYDLDNTWGIDYLGEDWARKSIYSWNRSWKPLYEKLLGIESCKLLFSAFVRELAVYMDSPELRGEVERWTAQISAWVQQDSWYSLDQGFSHTDFSLALDQAWNSGNDHVKYGVFEYAGIRSQTALSEALTTAPPPMISSFKGDPLPGSLTLEWTAETFSGPLSSTLHYRIDEGTWERIEDTSPVSVDAETGALTFNEAIPVPGSESLVEAYVTVDDQSAHTSMYPREHYTLSYPLLSGPLYINEFMASNSNAIMDSYGEYDDWVEIYNSGKNSIWMGDKFLSDDRGDPGKYRFPQENLDAGSFWLIWLDGQPEQGEKHAPFKIKSAGEHLRISAAPSKGYTPIDSLNFSLQSTDVAYGRSMDGGPEWSFFPMSTPGYSNLKVGFEELASEILQAYPNPVYDGMLYFSREISGTVYNMKGMALLHLQKAGWADVSSLNPGLYLLRTDRMETLRFVVGRK